MTATTDTRGVYVEAVKYAKQYSNKAIRGAVEAAFVDGADWQREQDDAWRATLQATINQQAEEIERLREAERRLIAMVKVGTGAA